MISYKNSKWIVIIFCLFHFLFIFGCAGPSLREQSIMRGLPAIYQKHNDGFILAPAERDIDSAIDLGKNSTNNDSLTYAYIIKGPYNFMSNSDVYVQISTPLYLISEHAREQAKEYKEIDNDFVDYCKGLDAVKISLTLQYVSDKFRAYPFQRQIILLRDGKRIEPLNTIQCYKGLNPFSSQLDKNIQDIIRKSQRMFQSQAVTRTPQQLKDLEQTYRDMGYSEAQIRTYVGLAREASKRTETLQQYGSSPTIALFDSDAIYKASDFKKPGKYEIVFRTPATNSLIVSGDKEIRFPISFDKFR